MPSALCAAEKPAAAEPAAAESAAAEPTTAEPKPAAAEPMPKPAAALPKPTAALPKPAAAESATTKPTAAEPATAEPAAEPTGAPMRRMVRRSRQPMGRQVQLVHSGMRQLRRVLRFSTTAIATASPGADRLPKQRRLGAQWQRLRR